MLEQLRAYYLERGIAAEAFRCEHSVQGLGSCRSVMKDFVSAREAFVGSEYEKGTLPRVLFVSVDASSDHPGRAPAERTLAYMRFWEENERQDPHGCDPDSLHKGRHWYWTHRIAHEILHPISVARHGQPIPFKHIHRYFAHTNSAKCKDATRGTGQGPELVFRNCRSHIPGEVQLLQPSVIVTQGRYGREAIEGAFPTASRLRHPANDRYEARVLRLGAREVLWIPTYHQNNYGEFNREKRVAYSWYFQLAREFASGSTAQP